MITQNTLPNSDQAMNNSSTMREWFAQRMLDVDPTLEVLSDKQINDLVHELRE